MTENPSLLLNENPNEVTGTATPEESREEGGRTTAIVTLRINLAIKDRLEVLANEAGRTLSQWIIFEVTKILEKQENPLAEINTKLDQLLTLAKNDQREALPERLTNEQVDQMTMSAFSASRGHRRP